MFKKKMLDEMSWTEVEELRKRVDTVLIPTGSVEVEGPHLPLAVDSIVALEVARRVAEGVEDVVVAPPINSGRFMPRRCISRATWTISSRLGVISPLSPTMSAPCSTAVSRILWQGTITPRSTIR